MNNTTKVLQLMLEAFNELKSQNKEIEINKYDDNLILFGAGATIDSMTLVSLIVDLESKISEEFSCEISLTDDLLQNWVVLKYYPLRFWLDLYHSSID